MELSQFLRLRARGFPLLVVVALAAAIAAGAALAQRSTTGEENAYVVHNLVSDGFVPADRTDPNLVNGWGLARGPSTPWWVADNETDVATIYRGDGTIVPLVVSVAGGPTGEVFNGGPNFVVHKRADSGPAVFLWASEDGKIRGWNPNVPAPAPSQRAVIAASRTKAGANYKGLAIASTPNGDFLYAADFHNARVDVFDGNFDRVRRAGSFMDPNLPEGYAPFGIQNIEGFILVTYALQDEEAEDEVACAGCGFVNAFDTEGNLLARVAGGEPLNAPWGVALAPPGFGKFSNDLLVGNFGDGRINAYALRSNGTFGFVGQLKSPAGEPIEVDGLWGIDFGNGGAAGPTTSLFFAAGPGDEEHGLFGVIEPG